jgi:hypothetical protein
MGQYLSLRNFHVISVETNIELTCLIQRSLNLCHYQQRIVYFALIDCFLHPFYLLSSFSSCPFTCPSYLHYFSSLLHLLEPE